MAFEYDKEHSLHIAVPAEQVALEGNLFIPNNSQGIIVFVHGSGSSRYSPRNRFVAQYLNKANFATLLFDLLTRTEEAEDLLTARLRFDIELLSARLLGVAQWISEQDQLKPYPLGLFGASTGAAAALLASTNINHVRAVVSRGGRPDLAKEILKSVKTPTLLIIGGLDTGVIELNAGAFDELATPAKKIEIVPGAGHLFEEPGALDEVARLATDWFIQFVH